MSQDSNIKGQVHSILLHCLSLQIPQNHKKPRKSSCHPLHWLSYPYSPTAPRVTSGFCRGLMCLSQGRFPYMWAALLTSQVTLSEMVQRRMEAKKQEFHRLSPQMHQGTSVGTTKHMSTTEILQYLEGRIVGCQWAPVDGGEEGLSKLQKKLGTVLDSKFNSFCIRNTLFRATLCGGHMPTYPQVQEG